MLASQSVLSGCPCVDSFGFLAQEATMRFRVHVPYGTSQIGLEGCAVRGADIQRQTKDGDACCSQSPVGPKISALARISADG